MRITLNRIYRFLGLNQQTNNDIVISQVVVDSRKVTKGSMFVALHGERTDGHEYIACAIEKGAAVILAEENYRRKIESDIASALLKKATIVYVEDTLKAMGIIAGGLLNDAEMLTLRKVAVTGSVGKTTTKEMIACCLSAGGNTHKTQGNRNSEIGFPMTIYDMPEDSEFAVCEMGMRGLGQIKYLTEIFRPHVAVITNIGIAHIELLGSQQNILRAKLEIVLGMENSEKSVLLLNGDDIMLSNKEAVLQILAEYGADKILVRYFGTDEKCDFRICNAQSTDKSQMFTLCYAETAQYAAQTPHGAQTPPGAQTAEKRLDVTINVPGAHNLMNAAASLACALLMDVDIDKAIAYLTEFGGEDVIRQKIITTAKGTIIDDTYNAGPESMKAALSVLSGMKADIKIAALADMLELGTFSRKAHEEVGEAASFCADILVAYGRLAEHYGSKFRGRKFMTDELDDTVNVLKELIDYYCMQSKNVAILVKGSNSMKMNTVANALQEYMNN